MSLSARGQFSRQLFKVTSVSWIPSGIMLIAGLLNFGTLRPIFADERSTPTEQSPEAEDDDEFADVDFERIPKPLENLQLSEKQQEQIKGVIQDYNRSTSRVWRKFSQRYMQAITMETSLLAAIEDNFTEVQRQRIRDLRRKTARHTMPEEDAADKSPAATTPPDPVEDAIASVGVVLTPEQEVLAERVEEKYRTKLRSLNREIHRLHSRLLALEADKLVALEKLLTKDQLQQLREDRKNKPEVPKVSAGESEGRTPE